MYDVELHDLVLLEGTVAVGLDGRVVDEDVRTTVGLGDEAVALLSVEPLHGSLSHDAHSPSGYYWDVVPDGRPARG